MRLARVLGAIGRTLIASGVILMMFAGYQLWGTGIQEARAQSSLDSDFDQLVQEFETIQSTDPDATADVAIEGSSAEGGSTADTVSTDGAVSTEAVAGDSATTSVGAGNRIEEGAQSAIGDAWTPEMLSLLYPGNGDPIARMDIPKIGMSKFIVEGVRVDDLRKGPGHYVNTPIPGTAGNVAIAGHRTTYGAPFHRIDELDPGDRITVTTLLGTFTYEVMPQVDAEGDVNGHFIVSPSDVGVLDDFGDNRLTLTACHPKYSAAQRIIVTALLVDEAVPVPPRPVASGGSGEVTLATEDFDSGATEAEAEALDTTEVPSTSAAGGTDTDTTPAAPEAQGSLQATQVITDAPIAVADDGFGEGLNGDRQAIAPAVSWGIAAIAVWVMASFIGRRWKRWPMYLIAITPFLLLLFISFTHIDQALPSY